MSRVTIKDVAKKAGVSTATVSRVINDSGFVSPELRDRVLLAIEQLDYYPNGLAKGLKVAKTHSLGLIISDIGNPFFTSVVRGVEDVAHQNGYSVILCNTDEDVGKERHYITVLQEKRVDGLIIGAASAVDSEHLFALKRRMPIVLMDRQVPGLDVSAVYVENEKTSYRVVSELIMQGHRRIGIVTAHGAMTGRQRLAGYKRALVEHALEIENELIGDGRFKTEIAYEVVREMMDLSNPPTALFVANNLMTIGAIEALRDMRVKIPEDCSLVAFDDMRWLALLDPPVSVVRQPTYRLGATAARLVLESIEYFRQDAFTPKVEVLPGEIVWRESTAPPGHKAAG